MKKVKLVTLGCRVNQYETQGMREALTRAGMAASVYDKQKEDADFVVINTCTVTHDADRENRYWIRKVKRENPKAKIIVTGCAVTRDRKKYEEIPEVDLVLANHHKAEIADFLSAGCGTPEGQSGYLDEEEERKKRLTYTPLSISHSEGRTRAFVKIQDGCNHACSFCKVVLVRGRSRSRAVRDVLDEVKRLRDGGHKEIVFAGIQLGAYGLDFQREKTTALVEVLQESSKIEGIERLRLSSIEPTDITPDLIETLAGIQKCCHHLHIPLQSGDSEILKGMNRRYTGEFYIGLVERLRAAMPDFCLSLDVMAGFPGETEAHFDRTMSLLRQILPMKCHIFPYSAREGTKAYRFDHALPVEVIRERVNRLSNLAQGLSARVYESFLGEEITVLVENIAQKRNENHHSVSGRELLLHGYTANYLKVFFKGGENQIGQLAKVRLLSLEKGVFLAECLNHQNFSKIKLPAENRL